MNLSLDKIRIDGGTQSRLKIDENVVAQYAYDLENGAEFPPVVVYNDGTDYWLSDGFHRYLSRKRINSPGINVTVREGTSRDALLNGIEANNKHGLRPSNEDKRHGVLIMLKDIEWQDMSDRQIAKIAGVSHTYVSNLRRELKEENKKSVNVATSKNRTKEEKPADPVADFTEAEVERETMAAAVEELQKQNEDLQDQLAIVMAASTDDIQKERAESVIKDLRAQLRAAEIELKEVTISRDMYQRENGELKKQVTSLLKKLKKYEQ
jgi:hypothetical protein